jgi:two-component sensor histidine kinase
MIALLWLTASHQKEKDIFLELINRIQAMSSLHEYLLIHKTFSTIRTYSTTPIFPHLKKEFFNNLTNI